MVVRVHACQALADAKGLSRAPTTLPRKSRNSDSSDLQSPVLGLVTFFTRTLYPLIDKGAKQRARYSLKALQSIDTWTIRYDLSRHRQPLRGTGTDELMVDMTLSKILASC
jgi:hypothetical protein